MSIFARDSFTGTAGTDLLDREGETGATWTRHPAAPFDATALNLWKLTGDGHAYVFPNSWDAGKTSFYLLSGTPDGAEYDLLGTALFDDPYDDSQHGFAFKCHATAYTHFRLIYATSLSAWYLMKVVAGTITFLGDPYADPVTGGDLRRVRIQVRTGGVAVLIDGVERITATDTTDTGGNRVGLFAWGSGGSAAADGIQFGPITLASVGYVEPEYTLTGPASGPPSFPSEPFTVTLAEGVDPGPVTITPAAVGLSGTFTPATVALSDTTRSAAFTFTASATGSGTIACTDSASLTDPAALSYAAGYFPPARLDSWRSRIHDRHATGANPYVAGEGYAPEGAEHYDVPLCVIQARDYCLRTSLGDADWSAEIAAAITRWRDRYLIAVVGATGGVQGYHRYITGLARHWYETGDPLDLDAVEIVAHASGAGILGEPDPARVARMNSAPDVTREAAFAALAEMDREWLGATPSPFLDPIIEACLGHVAMWTAPDGTYYGAFCKPFMAGLTLRTLIAYWDRHRDATETVRAALVAQVPDAVKACLEFLWDDCWYPVGTPAELNVGGGIYWDKGSVYYQRPATADLPPITGLTVQTVTSSKVFTGPSSLSTVDDYYKYSIYAADAAPTDRVTIWAYEGATRKFTLHPDYGPSSITPGAAFTISTFAQGTDDVLPSPALNPMVAPAYAWAYWHTKVVEGDTPGSLVHRARHDAMFDGATMAWQSVISQKEWNQAMLWTVQGLDWRDRGDAEWPAATAFNLQAPATGTSGDADVESGPFRLSIAHGVMLESPAEVVPATSTALGTIRPAAPVLTTDRPWAPFTVEPAAADDGSTVDVQATSTGLATPDPVAYAVGTPDTSPRLYRMTYKPAGGISLKWRAG